MQRLFSTFANGLPGVGLLLQRVFASGLLIQYAIVHLKASAGVLESLPQVIELATGLLLLLGLWTPVVGSVIVALQLWTFVSGVTDPWIPLLLAVLGTSLALIGPGAWSVDARLFGRKQIRVPQRQRGTGSP
ncbi:MAG: hypothetical protein WA399_16210 [Acidobacteriaceae bacterium]